MSLWEKISCFLLPILTTDPTVPDGIEIEQNIQEESDKYTQYREDRKLAEFKKCREKASYFYSIVIVFFIFLFIGVQ
ncbi:MAG: hypothetical protein ABFR62_08075, partial [Bacteroidota bacterium]